MVKRYPIGIQSFQKIRTDSYLYIDKTRYIKELVEAGTFFFLARPRRFGKSLLVSTLKELFRGNRDLFQGLWIEHNWHWNPFPVIHLSMNAIGYRDAGLEAALHRALTLQADDFGITLKETGLGTRFTELIRRVAATSSHKRVVVLIDEYDKPVIDYLADIQKAENNREIFKTFYGGIKECDEVLQFFLVTGVTRFHKVSVFSDLNNLRDISRESRFALLTGYSHEEVRLNFADEIDQICQARQSTTAETEKFIQDWYDGYSWDGQHFLYNPHSILSLMSSGEFSNFWFSTGTPTFLRSIVTDELIMQLQDVEVGPEIFEMSDLDTINPYALLLHAGYLTVKKRNDSGYQIGIPNREVRESLTPHLLGALAPSYDSRAKQFGLDLQSALRDKDFDRLFQYINSLLASIPYLLNHTGRESFYHAVIHIALQATGLSTQSEVVSARGRSDTIVTLGDEVFIFEFKLDQSPSDALTQIKTRDYAAPYRHRIASPIYHHAWLIGVNLSSAQRAVASWEVAQAW